MERALGLRNGALNLVRSGPVGLQPLPVFDRDAPSLHLNGGHADAGPQDEDVDLVFCPPVPQLDRVGKYDVVREAVSSARPRLPSPPTGRRRIRVLPECISLLPPAVLTWLIDFTQPIASFEDSSATQRTTHLDLPQAAPDAHPPTPPPE